MSPFPFRGVMSGFMAARKLADFRLELNMVASSSFMWQLSSYLTMCCYFKDGVKLCPSWISLWPTSCRGWESHHEFCVGSDMVGPWLICTYATWQEEHTKLLIQSSLWDKQAAQGHKMIGPKLGTAKGWKGNAACNDYEQLGRACVEFPAFDKLLKLLSLDFLICKMGVIIIIYPMVAVRIYSVIYSLTILNTPLGLWTFNR